MIRLMACRVCLAYDTRLCSIMDGQFRDIYEKLVEASLDMEDMLPTTVCYICYSLMKKFLRFIDKSRKANQILQQMIRSGLEPSVSSLDILVKEQTGLYWTLGMSKIDRNTMPSTSSEVKVKVELESVKSETDIDGMSDRNADDIPVYEDFTSDYEDDLPLQNISKRCITDRVKAEETSNVQLKNCNEHEGLITELGTHLDLTSFIVEVNNQGFNDKRSPAPPKKRKLDTNEAEKELVNIQTLFIKIEKDEEPRENIDDKKIIPYYKNAETTVISEDQNQSAFNKNDTVTPPKDIFTCDLCKNEYQCKIHLESHIKKSHIIESKRKDSINSDLNVKNKCKSTNLLKVREIQNKYNRKENDRRDNKFTDNTSRYECQYCMERFTFKYKLINHMRVHTKEKHFKCDLCEKGFYRRDHLTKHLRVHTKEKPFKCDLCEKSFSQSAHLTAHLRVHSKEKPFKCDLCKKDFSRRSNLTAHLKLHTNEKPFKCEMCEKVFALRNHLTAHLRVHTKVKPFKCDLCEKDFSQRSNLIAHLKLHTKEKPFKCETCDKRFPEKSTLTKHLRVHTKEKPFKCDICGKCFSLSSNLHRHFRVHSQEKPFKCETCEKCFSDKFTLIRHLKVHTNEQHYKCAI